MKSHQLKCWGGWVKQWWQSQSHHRFAPIYPNCERLVDPTWPHWTENQGNEKCEGDALIEKSYWAFRWLTQPWIPWVWHLENKWVKQLESCFTKRKWFQLHDLLIVTSLVREWTCVLRDKWPWLDPWKTVSFCHLLLMLSLIEVSFLLIDAYYTMGKERQIKRQWR